MVFSGEVRIDEPQLRVAEGDAVTGLRAIVGWPVVSARARLRFGPGRTFELLARMLDRAILQAEIAGLDPGSLIVADCTAHAAEDVVRVRRKAYGVADWFHIPTCHVQIVLQPAGLHAGDTVPPPSEWAAPVTVPADVSAEPADGKAVTVREALSDVIDPELGVNIVDLGLVREVAVKGQTAVITMTLTSPACPLTKVIEDQVRNELAKLDFIGDLRLDWQWLPAWGPADISDSGREQLRVIGFTI